MVWDLTIWRHFRVETPAEWELLRYSRNPEQGRCVFVDRYRARLELHWRRVPGAPDTGRMLSDYAARLEEEGARNIRRMSEGNWEGLACRQGGRPVSRFGRYFPEERCCLELVFPWPAVRDAEIERHVLSTVADEPARGGTRRWRAFGLDMAVPEHLELETCSRYAARAEFVFSAPRGVEMCRYMQLGMTAAWLRQPVGEWLSAQIPPGVRVEHATTGTEGAIERTYLRGRGRHWCRGLRLSRPAYEAAAGISPDDGRLYFAAHRGARMLDELALPFSRDRSAGDGVALACDTAPAVEGEPWGAMLRAVPVRNTAARVETANDGTAIVRVATAPAKRFPAPLSWIVPVRRESRIVLEQLGLAIWEMCDGRRTVERIVEVFSARHGLTFHEARLSVTGYLKELIQRGVLAIQVQPADSTGAVGL